MWTASPISAPTWPAPAGGVQTNQYPHLQGTVYAIPAIAIHVRAALTNTTPIGVTRGPGFGEAVNIMERLIDAAARQCGFDRIELRRRNFVRSTPMTNAFGFVVDSGDFRAAFDAALEQVPIWPVSQPAAWPARHAANAAASASPATSRPPAVRRPRTSTSASKPTAACR